MTEKVEIPQEVADAINYLKSERYPTRQIIKNALNANWCNEPEENDVNIEILNGMDAEKLVLAVHGYCEIEGYKVGEWVVYDEIDPKPAVKITAIQYELGRVQFEGMSNWRVIREIERHATPEEIQAEKERQLWAGIGRKIGEFRDGDLRMSKNNVTAKTTIPDFAAGEYFSGDLKGFFPVEAFISFEDGESK